MRTCRTCFITGFQRGSAVSFTAVVLPMLHPPDLRILELQVYTSKRFLTWKMYDFHSNQVVIVTCFLTDLNYRKLYFHQVFLHELYFWNISLFILVNEGVFVCVRPINVAPEANARAALPQTDSVPRYVYVAQRRTGFRERPPASATSTASSGEHTLVKLGWSFDQRWIVSRFCYLLF